MCVRHTSSVYLISLYCILVHYSSPNKHKIINDSYLFSELQYIMCCITFKISKYSMFSKMFLSNLSTVLKKVYQLCTVLLSIGEYHKIIFARQLVVLTGDSVDK